MFSSGLAKIISILHTNLVNQLQTVLTVVWELVAMVLKGICNLFLQIAKKKLGRRFAIVIEILSFASGNLIYVFTICKGVVTSLLQHLQAAILYVFTICKKVTNSFLQQLQAAIQYVLYLPFFAVFFSFLFSVSVIVELLAGGIQLQCRMQAVHRICMQIWMLFARWLDTCFLFFMAPLHNHTYL